MLCPDGSRVIDALNKSCFCNTLERDALRRALESDPGVHGLHLMIEQRCPHLFAAQPVFISRRDANAMASIVRAVEEATKLPRYREAVLAWAPEIARIDTGPHGVFFGYDFHIGRDGPRLIEINTNAGGAMLNAVLARAHRACCRQVEPWFGGSEKAALLEQRFVAMFLAEWRLAGRLGRPRRIAIVDSAPEGQYLYPEFLLFEQLFRRHGIEAVVRAPEQLRFTGGRLRDDAGEIDLLYNRLTDFALAEPAHVAIRDAYAAGAAVMTPHPRAHALYADKRNLVLLSDAALLRSWGLNEGAREALEDGVPRTEIVRPGEAERLWKERRALFFKPAAGYGGKAAYRGEKLTRRAWEGVLAGSYVAQALVPPGERRIGPEQPMKMDVRNYVYDADVQLLAARLYQGQTTNFRTEGGGFAPVLPLPDVLDTRQAA